MKTIEINGKEYSLNLTTRNCIALEEKMGKNPVEAIAVIADNQLPKTKDLALMFHYMLAGLNHGITLDDTYDLMDKYYADGHKMADLVNLFVDVLVDCGYISFDNKEESSPN